MGILTRSEKRLVEHHLRRYEIYRNRVDDYYASIGAVRVPEVMSRGNLPGDPTASQAMAAAEPPMDVQEAQRWLQVHRMTRERLGLEKRQLMEMIYYDDAQAQTVMEKLNIEQTTYFAWKDEVVVMCAMCAALKGVLEFDAETPGVFCQKSVI